MTRQSSRGRTPTDSVKRSKTRARPVVADVAGTGLGRGRYHRRLRRPRDGQATSIAAATDLNPDLRVVVYAEGSLPDFASRQTDLVVDPDLLGSDAVAEELWHSHTPAFSYKSPQVGPVAQSRYLEWKPRPETATSKSGARSANSLILRVTASVS